MDSHEVEILLVEDNPADAELTVRALRKHNLARRLQHVMDGAAAIEFLFAEGEHSERRGAAVPRVVLLDLKLPKLNGLEVLGRIKSDPRTQSIPVVVLTSSREQQDVVESYRLGVNSFVVKPVDYDQFAELIAKLGLYWALLNQPCR